MFRLSNKKALGQGLKCKVQLLVPGEELEISYNITSTGQDILNDVVSQLDLLDKDYYGLKLYDQIQWLDLTKSVVKQTKGLSSVVFVLRFKYYPAEPALLANESTRYFLYLQLRADLLEGRLRTDSQESLAYLIACVLQSELGDANTGSPGKSKHNDDNYVSEYKFVPNQSEDLEWAAIRLHQSEDFLGLRPADAELNFLKKSSQLDTYGIDPSPVKEGNSHNHHLIGVNHQGVSTYQDSKRTNLFTWKEIERISLDNKLVLIYCRRVEKKDGEKSASNKRSLFAFRCPTQEHAHNFWKIATEHRYFFTLETSPDEPIVTNTGGIFKKNHKLKYMGRVEKDLLRDHVDELRSTGVKRSRSLMSKTIGDGPLWHGFNQDHSGRFTNQGSMNNIYQSDSINKTLPSNMNYFREEEEDYALDQEHAKRQTTDATTQQQLLSNDNYNNNNNNTAGRLNNDGDGNHSANSKQFTRRSVLTSKTDPIGQAIRRGSQVYMDTEQQNHDFIRASILLLLTMLSILLIILLISDSDRPNSVSLLVKRMNLEPVSVALRTNYYLPLKTALRQTIGQVFSVLDVKLL